MFVIQAFRARPIAFQVMALIAVFVAINFTVHLYSSSADLFAVYFAAYNFGIGELDAVYPEPTPMFRLFVPDVWWTQAETFGVADRDFYPFIYPPIWAAVLSPITKIISPSTFAVIGFILNPALLGLCAVLTYRIIRPKMDMLLWVFLALILVIASNIGYVAIAQNQPQIVVTTLVLLALERTRAGADFSAGGALALAAAIKLSPTLFALLWLAQRNYRALSAFLAIGGALGILSILLTGWPLHQEFLNLISTISNSLVTCHICWNVDATITQWLLSDFLVSRAIEDQLNPNVTSVVVTAVKPEFLRIIDRILLITAIVLLYRAASNASTARMYRVIWPAALILFSFLSPLTWSYHYLTVIFFLPLFVDYFGRKGWFIFGAMVFFLNAGVLWMIDQTPSPYYVGQLVGSAMILGILCLFLTIKDDSAQTPP